MDNCGYLRAEGRSLRRLPSPMSANWQPKLFMGDGVKVTVGGAGDFTVTPSKNGLFAIGHARRWTKQFIQAVREQGAQPAQ